MARNESIISIEILVDDCLKAIFLHLPIVDRIRTERVSKRWNKLSKSSWNSFKKLDLYSENWKLEPNGFLSDNFKTIKLFNLEEVLKRCGNFLEDIKVPEVKENKILDVFTTYCSNIKLLQINITSIDDLATLVKNCKNIVELKIGFSKSEEKYFYEDELKKLLNNNKEKLRVIKFLSSVSLTGSCFLNLPFLETLDLEKVELLESRNLADSIKVMKNLKVLKVILSEKMVTGLIWALQRCKNLEVLDFQGQYRRLQVLPCEELNLEDLFKNNQKLKILKLSDSDIKGNCLITLNDESIKELVIKNCGKFDCSYLNKYFFKLRNLYKFVYENQRVINSYKYRELKKFISILINLRHLKIHIFGNMPDDNSLTDISFLIYLEELDLSANFIKDCSLEIYGENFKNLKKLKLCCKNVTDVGLHAITSLPKLEGLSLLRMDEITDKGFNKMENLKKLELITCKNITGDGLKKILRVSKKLEHLFIQKCFCVDREDFLLYANKITKNRKNNITLFIHDCILDYLNLQNFKNIKKSPFLKYTNEFQFFETQ